MAFLLVDLPKRVNTRASFWAACICSFYILITIARFFAAGRDDIYIFLWAGKSLGTGPWLVNYNGTPEDIVSSLLVPIVVRGLYALSAETAEVTIRCAGIITGLISLAVFWLSRRSYGLSNRYALIGIAFVSLNPAFQYWASGGMETPYHVLAYTLYCPLVGRALACARSRDFLLLGLLQVFFVLCRTDGFLIVAVTAFLLLITKCRDYRGIVVSLGLPAASFCLLGVARYLTTNSFWPNPTLAKGQLSVANIHSGLLYLLQAYQSSLAGYLYLFGLGIALVRLLRWGLLCSRGNQEEVAVLAAVACILLQDAFCLLVGGNWMEYHRFWIPTISLHAALLAHAIMRAERAWCSMDRYRYLLCINIIPLSLAVLQQGDDGLNTRWFNTKGQATPLLWDWWHSNATSPGLVQQVRLHNGSSRRDTEQLLPFIRDELPRYLDQGPIRVVSYQAGYFPFMLRKFYSPAEVLFLDSVGLASMEVAQLAMPKNFVGVVAGTHLGQVLGGKAGPLSAVAARFNPNMIYTLDAQADDVAEFTRLGFVKVWDRPGAVIWFRSKADQ